MAEGRFAELGWLAAGAAAAAGFLVLGLVVRFSARRGAGLYHWLPAALLASLAVAVGRSGRDLSQTYDVQSRLLAGSDPVADGLTKLVSVLVVLVSVERILSHAMVVRRPGRSPVALLAAFVGLWLGTVASPALLGANGAFEHDYLYPLALGVAALLLRPAEVDDLIGVTRTAGLGFVGLGLLLIPLAPSAVLEQGYAGWLPGVPRFAGLAPHSVALAMLAQLALLALAARPFGAAWANRVGWLVGLAGLLAAQSKTAWVTFPVCLAFLEWGRPAASAGPRRRPGPRSALVAVALAGTIAVLALLVFSDFASESLTRQQSADLASLSGRDRVWQAALAEWGRHPWLGYGSRLFDPVHRAEIGLSYATNGHNQLIDTLARSGILGLSSLLLYVVVIAWFAVRYGRASRGLTLALAAAVFGRAVTEVPLSVFQYGPEALQHFVLLAVLGREARARSLAVVDIPTAPPVFRRIAAHV